VAKGLSDRGKNLKRQRNELGTNTSHSRRAFQTKTKQSRRTPWDFLKIQFIKTT
jgi:hypothetical protein